MSSTAVSLRHDATQQSGPETGTHDAAQAMSTRLVTYWRDTLPRPVTARRRALDAVCARARRDVTAVNDMLPFALGDHDEEIVYRATLAHVGAYPPGASTLSTTAAIEWVRRRLAINCAAVFSALLSIGDERVLEALLPLRSALSSDEVAAVRRRMGSDCPAAARAFLESWVALLDPAAGTR